MADSATVLVILAVICIFVGLLFLIRRRNRTTEHQVTTYRPQIVMTPQMMAPPSAPQVIVTQPSPTYVVSPAPSPPMMHQPQPMTAHIYHPSAHAGHPSSPGYHY